MKDSTKITTYTRENGVKVYTLEVNGKPLKSSTNAYKLHKIINK